MNKKRYLQEKKKLKRILKNALLKENKATKSMAEQACSI